MKRAIALAGGGPAAGLHIGALDFFNQKNMKFDVWALSCIGAWVGILYNQFDGKQADKTYDFFRERIFREDVSYSRFPVNRVFGPDWVDNTRAFFQFFADPNNYQNLVLPDKIVESARHTAALLADRSKWNEGDINQWIHNDVMAINPAIRFMTSLMFKSNVTGLSRIYYPDSNFINEIKFNKLYEADKPFIFHNAWNLTKQDLFLFANKIVPPRTINGRDLPEKHYDDINAASLCACSALPYIEGTVVINGDTFCEGALIDTVNFKNLIEDHPDLDEIWINRIVDAHQVHAPKNLHDALANLCQLFAASVGDDDVRLFKYHIKYDEDRWWKGTVVEIRVDGRINFDWSVSNLEQGYKRGYAAAQEAYEQYMSRMNGGKNGTNEVVFIPASTEPGLPEAPNGRSVHRHQGVAHHHHRN